MIIYKNRNLGKFALTLGSILGFLSMSSMSILGAEKPGNPGPSWILDHKLVDDFHKNDYKVDFTAWMQYKKKEEVHFHHFEYAEKWQSSAKRFVTHESDTTESPLFNSPMSDVKGRKGVTLRFWLQPRLGSDNIDNKWLELEYKDGELPVIPDDGETVGEYMADLEVLARCSKKTNEVNKQTCHLIVQRKCPQVS